MLIEQLTTRELENLHQRHSFLLAQVRTEKEQKSKRDFLRLWEAELDAITKEISDSTLGIKHLLREVGQINKALQEASSQTNTVSLPIICGIPI